MTTPAILLTPSPVDLWRLWPDDFMCPVGEFDREVRNGRSDDAELVQVLEYDPHGTPSYWVSARNAPSPAYSDMVTRLFNRCGSQEAAVMHACVGLVGEYFEYAAAKTEAQRREELGDMEFYFEALRQSLGQLGFPHVGHSCPHVELLAYTLDLGKRAWAYGKPLDETPHWEFLCAWRRKLTAMHKANSCTAAQARELNMEKLAKRFPGGVFASADALARADKAPGE